MLPRQLGDETVRLGFLDHVKDRVSKFTLKNKETNWRYKSGSAKYWYPKKKFVEAIEEPSLDPFGVFAVFEDALKRELSPEDVFAAIDSHMSQFNIRAVKVRPQRPLSKDNETIRIEFNDGTNIEKRNPFTTSDTKAGGEHSIVGRSAIIDTGSTPEGEVYIIPLAKYKDEYYKSNPKGIVLVNEDTFQHNPVDGLATLLHELGHATEALNESGRTIITPEGTCYQDVQADTERYSSLFGLKAAMLLHQYGYDQETCIDYGTRQAALYNYIVNENLNLV